MNSFVHDLREPSVFNRQTDVIIIPGYADLSVTSKRWKEILPLRAVRIQLVRQLGKNNWSFALVIHNGVCSMGASQWFLRRYRPIHFCCTKVHRGRLCIPKCILRSRCLGCRRPCLFFALSFFSALLKWRRSKCLRLLHILPFTFSLYTLAKWWN